MDVGTSVIFYTETQRRGQSDENIYQSNTTIGTIKEYQPASGEYVIQYESIVGILEETVPERYVRAARFIAFYEFWKFKGFYNSLWGYILFILIVFLFLY